MNNTLRALAVILPLAALLLAIASFAPLPLADFDRFTMRVACVVALLIAFIANETRNIFRMR